MNKEPEQFLSLIRSFIFHPFWLPSDLRNQSRLFSYANICCFRFKWFRGRNIVFHKRAPVLNIDIVKDVRVLITYLPRYFESYTCFFHTQNCPTNWVKVTPACHFLRSSYPELFLGRRVLKICSKLLCSFIEITLRHGCSPVNLLYIFRAPFLKNTPGWLLLVSAFITFYASVPDFCESFFFFCLTYTVRRLVKAFL